MNKKSALKTSTSLQVAGACESTGPGLSTLSQAQKVQRKRAAKALANARQRCTNPNNPDYSNYGALGVMVLFDNVDELLQAIGLPKPGQSLDRIDPNGHYVANNVRWTSSLVQAANKKSSPSNIHYSDAAMINNAQDALAMRFERKVATAAFRRAVFAWNRGSLPAEQAHWFAENVKFAGVLEAGFDLNTVDDQANPEPGYVHLPALSLPNSRVRIRAFPSPTPRLPEKLISTGRLGGMDRLDPDWNVHPNVWKRVSEQVTQNGPGIVFYGVPTQQALLGGWIEGSFLAMASHIPMIHGQTAAFVPMLRVHALLSNLGYPSDWDEMHHELLDVGSLLIPDFALDCGPWGELPSGPWWKIEALLQYRWRRGRQTFLGAQRLGKIHIAARELVLGAFSAVPMPHMPEHDCPALQFADASWAVDEGETTLSQLAIDPNLSKIVTHSGLIGT